MTTDQTSGLESMLCFDLYAASRAMTAAYRPILDPHALTYPQYLVLVALWTRDEVTIKQLAVTLHLDHATLTPLLRRLEERGLLTRLRSTDDARAVRVALTADGEDLRRILPDVQCAITAATGLGPRQLDELGQVLRELTGRLASSTAPPD